MAKITELPQGNGLSATDVFPYVDVPNNVTKKYPASGLLSALASTDTSDVMAALMENTLPGDRHRMFFGGRNLGTSVTAAQKTAIQNGTFTGLLVGDYWVINGVNWRIVDMDYWYGCGSPVWVNHHLVIMPDSPLANAVMNETNTTEGGYIGSKMYKDTLPTVKATCQAAFPSMVLSHREYLVSKVTDGKPSEGTWVDSSVELPSEIMMYGSHIISPGNSGALPSAILYTTNKQQLALFNLAPHFAAQSAFLWLRDIVASSLFARVNVDGCAGTGLASNDGGVRPVFPIGVA